MEKIQPNITLLLPLTSPVARLPVVVLTGALDLLAPGIDLTCDFDVQMSPLLAVKKLLLGAWSCVGGKTRSCKGVGLMVEKSTMWDCKYR